MKKKYKRALAAALAAVMIWNTCDWHPQALAGSSVQYIEEVKELSDEILHQEVPYGTKYKDLELPDKLPRLISAQSYGCYPINRAIQENKPWEPMEENTIADSISVGVPRNADKALAAIRESNGIAVCVTDEEILAAQRLLGRTCGVFGEPAGVTGAAALKKACEEGLIEKDATVVSVVTGNGLKDVANAIKSAGEPLHIEPDLDLMVKGFAERGVTVE